jgi:hypothetical protein
MWSGSGRREGDMFHVEAAQGDAYNLGGQYVCCGGFLASIIPNVPNDL